MKTGARWRRASFSSSDEAYGSMEAIVLSKRRRDQEPNIVAVEVMDCGSFCAFAADTVMVDRSVVLVF